MLKMSKKFRNLYPFSVYVLNQVSLLKPSKLKKALIIQHWYFKLKAGLIKPRKQYTFSQVVREKTNPFRKAKLPPQLTSKTMSTSKSTKNTNNMSGYRSTSPSTSKPSNYQSRAKSPMLRPTTQTSKA